VALSTQLTFRGYSKQRCSLFRAVFAELRLPLARECKLSKVIIVITGIVCAFLGVAPRTVCILLVFSQGNEIVALGFLFAQAH
jgi:hypothetical protein